MNAVIHEYAKHRARAFLHWFPNAVIRRRYLGEERVDSFDLLILSGGPCSAHRQSREQNPFLEEDLKMLQEIDPHSSGAPFVLGVCLGAQLMVFAFGGNVTDGSEEITGWNEIELKAPHPAFDGLIRPLHCEIHKNHIDQLPDGAVLLASSAYDAIEAFSIGSRFLGTAYHPEITKNDISWFAEVPKIRLDYLKPSTVTLEEGLSASRQFFKNIAMLADGQISDGLSM